MSSLKGDGSGVMETDEVSMLESVSMVVVEVEISSATADLGRRTPWPEARPGLFEVLCTHV